MPLKINVGTNETARSILNEMLRPDNNNAPNNVAEQPVQQVAAQAERPADGLLMRTLRQIRREEGPSHAAYLRDVVVEKKVNLELDHSDEVDGGVSTRAMDNDWVEVDFASDLGKGPGGSRDDSHAVLAQQTMAELEDVSVDDVRTTYANFLVGLEGMDETQKKDALRKVLTAPGDGDPQGPITRAIKAQKDLQDSLVQAIMQQPVPDRAMITALHRSILCTNALIDLAIGTLMASDGAESYQGATVAEALGRKMQPEGTQQRRETTEKVVRIFDEQLADLNRVYDSLSAKGHVVTANEFKLLETGLAKARKLLTDAQDGVRLKGGRNVVNLGSQDLDKDVLRQLEARIGEMSSRVERLKVESLSVAAHGISDAFSFDLLDSPLFDGKYVDQFLDEYCERLIEGDRQNARTQVKGFRDGLANLKAAFVKGCKTGQMDEAREILRSLKGTVNLGTIDDYVRRAQVSSQVQKTEHIPDLTEDSRKRLCGRLNELYSVLEKSGGVLLDRFEDMAKNVHVGTTPAVNGALLAKVMDGSCGFATAALATAWGADESSFEPGIDDRYLFSSRDLGSGACNSVKLCSYRRPNGSKELRVFKAEIPARVSMENMEDKKTYAPLQNVSKLNISVRRMAEQLGLGNLVVDSRVGVHNGQFGLMMEKADGATGESITQAFSKGDVDRRIGQKSIGELQRILDENGPDAQTLIGNLRQAMTDLDWLDHIVGQTDRNWCNYMISVGDDLSVTLKGIDNDFSFSPDNEKLSEGRAYPSVISEETYIKLGQLYGELYDMPADYVRDWFARKGFVGLTDAQIKKTVERIGNAWKHANSPDKCTIIRNKADWCSVDSMKQQAQTAKSQGLKPDYFSRDVLSKDMFFRAGLSDESLLSWGGNEQNRRVRQRFVHMQNVMNGEDFPQMFQRLAAGEPSVSESELKAYFSILARNPLSAAGNAVKKWPKDNDKGKILSGLVEMVRSAKKKLADELGAANVRLPNIAQESLMQMYFTSNGGNIQKNNLVAFRKEVEVISRHLESVGQEVRDLFKFGGSFDSISFIAECKRKAPTGVDEALVAEALMSELAKPGFDPEGMDVGRLRRLVVNKLKVTPSEVPEMPVTLDEGSMALFRKACAITPAGEDYYAKVKEEYDKLVDEKLYGADNKRERDARKLED